MDKLEEIGLEIVNTSFLEWIAVLCSLLYVILIARRRIGGWYMAAIGSGIYVYLCFINQLYLDSILQLFYVSMAIWGWYNWHKTRFDDEFIIRWTISHHLINILSSAGFTWILGYLFDTYTDQAMPYLDAFITVFSLGATFMVAKKVLENWIYWIIIDVVSVQLYLNKDLNLTALLYVFYTIMSVIGLVSWYYYYRKQIKV